MKKKTPGTPKAPEPFLQKKCKSCGTTNSTYNPAYLRYRREQASVGLRALARRGRISAATLSNVENGAMSLTPRVLKVYRHLLTALLLLGSAAQFSACDSTVTQPAPTMRKALPPLVRDTGFILFTPVVRR